MPAPDHLKGDSVLYAYLQKELLEEDVWLFQMLTARLVTSLGVWISPDIYQRLPVLLPHVVRDESARGRKNGVEMWGSPSAAGFFRDDNSLIKELVKSLRISSPRATYNGRRIGRAGGWVASHVWQRRVDGTLASREPSTNSFVPNLVWLPRELSLLSDRTGFVQRYLQAIAHKVYGHIEFAGELDVVVTEAWDALEVPDDLPEQGLPEPATLNFFEADERWISSRYTRLESILDALEAGALGNPIPAGSHSRYRERLGDPEAGATEALRGHLRRYIDGLHATQHAAGPPAPGRVGGDSVHRPTGRRTASSARR